MSIGVHGCVLVVRRAPSGGSVLTERAMVAVPAPIRRWCGFEAGERVLLVAVPSLSALVIPGQEVLERLLPDPERLVSGVGRTGRPAVEVGYGAEVAGG
ncbi:hypothetical protein ACQPYE_19220 [Actinosynnema sp. CA-299493]